MTNNSLRDTSVAGQFYSNDPQQLEFQINSFIENIELTKFKDQHTRAVILPHAGYTFSGKIAAQTLATASNIEYDRIIILCPSHYVGFSGMALPTYSRCKTPLGELEVDTKAVEVLSTEGFTTNPEAHKQEHSLEVQLPLIKKIFNNVPIVPIICGYAEGEKHSRMIKALYSFFDKSTLWLISSDFTHYGKSFNYLPFTNNIKENLRELDLGAVEKILLMKSMNFKEYINKTGATICGAKPITTLLELIESSSKQGKQIIKGELVKYTTSGDMTGDFQHCVSYAGITFYDV